MAQLLPSMTFSEDDIPVATADSIHTIQQWVPLWAESGLQENPPSYLKTTQLLDSVPTMLYSHL